MKFICDMSTGQTYLGKFMKVFVKKFVSLVFCQKWRIKKKKIFEVTREAKQVI